MQIGQIRYEHRPLPELALIFRAMMGDEPVIALNENEVYKPADTFGEFLDINKLPGFEEVCRSAYPQSVINGRVR